MERTMTLWRTERGSAPLVTSKDPAGYGDLAAVVAIVAAPVIVLLWLVPLPLFLPLLSITSFVIASVAALVAHYSGIDRRAPGVSTWGVAAVFTLIWIGAAMLSGTKQFVELFDRLVMIP
jgi:phosphatidylglycerophosphate synthase